MKHKYYGHLGQLSNLSIFESLRTYSFILKDKRVCRIMTQSPERVFFYFFTQKY
jgi:hypothetical protein